MSGKVQGASRNKGTIANLRSPAAAVNGQAPAPRRAFACKAALARLRIRHGRQLLTATPRRSRLLEDGPVRYVLGLQFGLPP